LVPNEILSSEVLSGVWARAALPADKQAIMTLAAATAMAAMEILVLARQRGGMNAFSPVAALRLRERDLKGE
jgi:hypothetical protein